MAESIIHEKAFAFACKRLGVYRALQAKHSEWILPSQLLRSGTSIGANAEEAIGGQSKRDFPAKMSIALKEARTTRYWLPALLHSTELQGPQPEALLSDCEEILTIFNSVVLTTRQKIGEKHCDGSVLKSTTSNVHANSILLTLHSSLDRSGERGGMP